ncbi:MAG: MFS transporter [Acidimicrobiales bacterium]
MTDGEVVPTPALSNGEDAVPRRSQVPSRREVEMGQASPGSTFEPTPPPPERERAGIRASARAAVAQADPRRINSPYGLRPLITVSMVGALAAWDDTAFGVLLPEIKDEFGFSLTFLLTLGSVVTIFTTLLAPAIGFLADRVNRVRMLGIGNVIANIASVLAALSPGLGLLTASRLTGGLGGSVSEPAGYPLITDWYPQESRARVFAFQGAVGRVGAILGPLVGGGLGFLFGWRPAVLALGIVATLLSLLLFTLPEPVRGALERGEGGTDTSAGVEPPPMSWGEAWRAAASITTVRRIWYATPFLGMAGGGLASLTGLYFEQEFGVGPLGRGFYGAGLGVVGVISLVVAAPHADRLLQAEPSRVMALFGVITALNALPILALVLSPFLWVSIVVGLPLGFLAAAVGPALGALLSLVIPARLRGLGMQTFKPWSLFGVLGLIVVGMMGDTYGLRTAIMLLIPIYLIGALILTSAAGGVARDIRAATAATVADRDSRQSRDDGKPKLLVCRDIDVTYDGAQVLFNVDLDVDEGELIALVGTNGAGKSTLLRAIAGIQEASNGAIFLDGDDITHRPPAENARRGVVFVPGGRAIFPSLTVADNLRTAGYLYRDDPAWVAARTTEVFELFPMLRERHDEVAGNLSGGEQQMLAVGQAFLMRPRLLMIDELSLGLAPAVVETLLGVVRQLNSMGTTIVLVEQSINLALTVAHRAVFLEKGQVRFDGPTADLLHRSDLMRAVFLAGTGGGAAIARRPRPTSTDRAEPVLDATDIHVSYGGVRALAGASVRVIPGEVLGIIGPNGAGKTTLFDVISGFVSPDQGTLTIAGTDALALPPDRRARLGLARSFQNARLFPSLTVRDAIAVALDRHLLTRSAVAAALWAPQVRRSERRVERRVEWLVDLFSLQPFADKFITELSTGSRRIVDLACIMAAEPTVLLLDEPSSGLAQAESEALGPVIRRLARDTDCAVLVIEHDIPLVTSLSDRMLAMELGRPIVEGSPVEVVDHPRVSEAYLGADPTVVDRSGPLHAALEAAGITDSQTRSTT